MHRLQIQLTPEQERSLRRLARARKTSISFLIREGVDRLLESGDSAVQIRDRGLATIGKYRSGRHESHDSAFEAVILDSKSI